MKKLFNSWSSFLMMTGALFCFGVGSWKLYQSVQIEPLFTEDREIPENSELKNMEFFSFVPGSVLDMGELELCEAGWIDTPEMEQLFASIMEPDQSKNGFFHIRMKKEQFCDLNVDVYLRSGQKDHEEEILQTPMLYAYRGEGTSSSWVLLCDVPEGEIVDVYGVFDMKESVTAFQLRILQGGFTGLVDVVV